MILVSKQVLLSTTTSPTHSSLLMSVETRDLRQQQEVAR